MEDYDRSVLTKAGIPGLLIDENRGRLTYEQLLKSIFHPKREGYDPHSTSLAELMVSDDLLEKEGRFQDFLLMANAEKAHAHLVEAFERGITTDDILEYRRLLLADLFGKQVDGTRRFKVRVGNVFVTIPPNEVGERLGQVVDILRRNPSTTMGVLASAADFFAEFVKLHPFEDENGRLARSITNAYLRSKGLRPFFADRGTHEIYTESPDLFYFTGYRGNVVPGLMYMSLDREGKKRFIGLLERFAPENLYELGSKQKMLSLFGRGDRRQLRKDMEMLFAEGVSRNDQLLVMDALCIASNAKMDSHILYDALRGGYSGARTAAVFAIRHLDYERHKAVIRETARTDEDLGVKMLAIGIIDRHRGFDLEFSEEVIRNEQRSGVISSLGKSLTLIPESREFLPLADLLFEKGHRDLTIRGYQVFITHANEAEIARMLGEKLQGERPEVVRLIMLELGFSSKINLPMVAEALCGFARGNREVREHLLGELTRGGRVDGVYLPFLHEILENDSFTRVERAYAAYLLGKELGYSYLQREFGMGLDRQGTTIENVAVFLAFTDSLEKGRAPLSELDALLATSDRSLRFVELIELGRLVSMGKVGGEAARKLTERIKSSSTNEDNGVAVALRELCVRRAELSEAASRTARAENSGNGVRQGQRLRGTR